MQQQPAEVLCRQRWTLTVKRNPRSLSVYLLLLNDAVRCRHGGLSERAAVVGQSAQRQVEARSATRLAAPKDGHDAGNPAKQVGAGTMVAGWSRGQNDEPRGARTPLLDGAGDDDADTGIHTTVPDDDRDVASPFGQRNRDPRY